MTCIHRYMVESTDGCDAKGGLYFNDDGSCVDWLPTDMMQDFDERRNSPGSDALMKEWASFACGKQPVKSCPTCNGGGFISMGNGMYPDCPNCDGTGEKK